MKITDLKNGAVVEIRLGNRYIKVDNTLLNLKMDGSYLPMSHYDDNLRSKDDDVSFDIVKVWDNTLSSQDYCNRALFQAAHNQFPSWQETMILDDIEKEYLENVLKPFKNKITSIGVFQSLFGANFAFLEVNFISKYEHLVFPHFYKGAMYKGMEIGKRYTLNELELFKEC